MPLVSQSEFAGLHGVSRKTATKWKEAGRLVFVDGKVDVDQSDALLRDAGLGRFGKVTRQGNKSVPPKRPPARSPTPHSQEGAEGDAEADLPGGIGDLPDAGTIQQFLTNLLNGNYASKAQAERVKENALAGARALELQQKAGALVEMEVAERALFEVFRSARDSWLNWPSRIGPMLAADLGLPPDKVVEALTKHVHEHLSELGEPAADFEREV